MPRGDLRAANAEPLEPACLQHPTRRKLAVRVLEDASERALVRRLCRLSVGLHLGDDRLDLVRRPRLERELDLGYDLPAAQPRPSVLEPELVRPQPMRTCGIDHERAREHAGDVASVRARVHPNGAAGRSWDGARELQPP